MRIRPEGAPAAQPQTDKELAAHRAYLTPREVGTAGQAAELQRGLGLLHAKPADHGLVLTVGDVLFSTGKADLKPGATGNLNKLVAFLDRYRDRTVAIQGYTDSVGGAEYNQDLSERRANSVKSYLAGQGIGSMRLSALGKGQRDPVADNDSADGRQQNRRVEVIVSNTPAAVPQRPPTAKMIALLVLLESLAGPPRRPLLSSTGGCQSNPTAKMCQK